MCSEKTGGELAVPAGSRAGPPSLPVPASPAARARGPGQERLVFGNASALAGSWVTVPAPREAGRHPRCPLPRGGASEQAGAEPLGPTLRLG